MFANKSRNISQEQVRRINYCGKTEQKARKAVTFSTLRKICSGLGYHTINVDNFHRNGRKFCISCIVVDNYFE